MSKDMDRYKESFNEEVSELLSELETSLLEMEGSRGDMELIGRVFRALHNIKGLAAMFDYKETAWFTHELEDIFDVFRSGGAPVTERTIDLGLSAKDQIKSMLANTGKKGKGGRKKAEGIITAFRDLMPGTGKQSSFPQAPAMDGRKAEPTAGASSYLIRFKPDRDIFKAGIRPTGVLNELRSLGRCAVAARTEAIPPLGEMDPEICYTSWDVVLATGKGIDAVRDAFVFVEGNCELTIDVISQGEDVLEGDNLEIIEKALAEWADLTADDIREAVGLGRDTEDAASPGQFGETDSIRVLSSKLDSLAGTVGELVTVQARLSQTAALKNDPDLQLIAEEMERLTEGIRESTMSIRLVPIGAMFKKLRRLVRDLSARLGRDVRLVTEGAETELDKSVMEKLGDPLMHIVRNALDHGIEPAGGRVRRGKPGQGTIHIKAEHSGGNVLIQIGDDGAGIDVEAVRAKAVEKGLVEKDSELSDEEIYKLIFMPGFSSRSEVTDVSGRGVGLDVVKRAIDALRGSISVTSQKGLGTAITLRLPLTLAIIDGLLVKVADESFVFPLSAVEECVELTREDVARANGRHTAVVRGEMVPYVHLGEWFRAGGEEPPIQQVVITGTNGSRVGFVVDKVVGEHQTVIKNIGGLYRGVEGISGATILGDGSVALILDIKDIVRGVQAEEEACTVQGRQNRNQFNEA